MLISFDVKALFTSINIIKETLVNDDQFDNRTRLSCDNVLKLVKLCLSLRFPWMRIRTNYFLMEIKCISYESGYSGNDGVERQITNEVTESVCSLNQDRAIVKKLMRNLANRIRILRRFLTLIIIRV